MIHDFEKPIRVDGCSFIGGRLVFLREMVSDIRPHLILQPHIVVSPRTNLLLLGAHEGLDIGEIKLLPTGSIQEESTPSPISGRRYLKLSELLARRQEAAFDKPALRMMYLPMAKAMMMIAGVFPTPGHSIAIKPKESRSG